MFAPYKTRLLGVATIAVAWGLGAAVSVWSLQLYAGPDDDADTTSAAQPRTKPVHMDRSGRIDIPMADGTIRMASLR
jgi:hypothetical protein